MYQRSVDICPKVRRVLVTPHKLMQAKPVRPRRDCVGLQRLMDTIKNRADFLVIEHSVLERAILVVISTGHDGFDRP